MLRLIIEEKERVVQSASLPVRWCISKEVINVLKERKVVNPYILIVTVADGREMTRQLVPMEDTMIYVQFAKPGENTIFAHIVWNADGEFNSLWKTYLRRSEGRYYTDVINSAGEMFGDQHGPLRIASVKVIVPKELFAKEPPEWEQRWVNAYFSQPPRDQCEYRKRRLIAYTLQPIWFVIRFILGVLLAILALLLAKSPELKPLVCLSMNIGDVIV